MMSNTKKGDDARNPIPEFKHEVQHLGEWTIPTGGCVDRGARYSLFSQDEWDTPTVCLGEQKNLREIGRILKRAPSTISRDILRNAPPVLTGYNLPRKAQQRAEERKQKASQQPRLKSPKIKA